MGEERLFALEEHGSTAERSNCRGVSRNAPTENTEMLEPKNAPTILKSQLHFQESGVAFFDELAVGVRGKSCLEERFLETMDASCRRADRVSCSSMACC